MKYHQSAHREIEQSALQNLATPQEAKATANSWLPVLSRYEIADSSAFAVTIGEINRKPPTSEQVANWRKEAAHVLQADYGDRAGEALRDTQKLIASDKQLLRFLEETKAGDHPQVIRSLAASAAAARKAGKLK